ncbi:MAG: response regulator transcription factor [Candidatus Rokuibacteriota bacterium]
MDAAAHRGAGELPSRGSGQPLTAREIQVGVLIQHGRANKQIAHELGISVHTVKQHRREIYRKLGVHNTAELCRRRLVPRALPQL